jgi:hypothetical protein
MKIELVSYATGGLALELIAENDLEVALLRHAWRVMGNGAAPTIGNGKTITGSGSTGFFLPVTPSATGET